MSTSLYGPLSSGVAAGGAGSATNNTTSSIIIRGLIHAVYIAYYDSPPATTDVTVATAGVSVLPAETILSLANANTDGVFHPYNQADNSSGAPIAEYTQNYIHDKVKVTIAGANAGDYVEVYLVVVDH